MKLDILVVTLLNITIWHFFQRYYDQKYNVYVTVITILLNVLYLAYTSYFGYIFVYPR